MRSSMAWSLLFAVVFVLCLSVVGLAATDVVPDGLAALLDDVVIVFGAVAFGWMGLQRGAIHILKGMTIGDKPLLDNETKIWLANAALAIIGITLATTQTGQSIWASLFQAVFAVFGSVGLHRFNKEVGKSSAKSAPVTTG